MTDKYNPAMSYFGTLAWFFVLYVVFPVIGAIIIILVITYELMFYYIIKKGL